MEDLDKPQLLELVKKYRNYLEKFAYECCKCFAWINYKYTVDNKIYCEKCSPKTHHLHGCGECDTFYTDQDMKTFPLFDCEYHCVCLKCIDTIDETIWPIESIKVLNKEWYTHCFGYSAIKEDSGNFKFDFNRDRKFFNMITRFNNHKNMIGVKGTIISYNNLEESPKQVYDNVRLLYVYLRRQRFPKPICQMIVSFYLQ